MNSSRHSSDIVKFVFSIIIVIVHIDYNQDFYIISNYLARVGVPFFFISSGYVFYKKIHQGVDNRYINNILHTYMKLFIIYIPIGVIQLKTLTSSNIIIGNTAINHIFQLIMVILVYGSSYHLWYLPAVIFSLSVIKFFYIKIRIEYMIILSFLFYLIGAFETYYGILPSQIQSIMSLYFQYFQTTRNGLFFGLIFVLIGFYLAKKNVRINNLKLKITLASLAMVMECIIVNALPNVRDYNFFLSLIPLVTLIFIGCLQVKTSFNTNFYAVASKQIYFYHVGVIYILQIMCRYLNIGIYDANSFFRLISVLFITATIIHIKGNNQSLKYKTRNST